MELNYKAHQLLEKIANSVYERSPPNSNSLFFSVSEISLVADWLDEFLNNFL
jgi:hypothetical protein